MKRISLKYLQQNWLQSPNRKPLIIRGARQVGKTWLIHNFCEINQKKIFELNFEKNPELKSLFENNDPKQILLNISAHFNETIEYEHSVLFLDEIQVFPELLAKLRWFYEELPALPVIAAGSLLDFVLEDATFSMPVGRINYLYLEPLSFEEFLLANNKELLLDYLRNYSWEMQIPSVIHTQLNQLLKEYIIVGGMPQAVLNWVTQKSPVTLNQIHHDLMTTYRDDFGKYKGRFAKESFDTILMAISKFLGQKIIYQKMDPILHINAIKQILHLFNQAKLCTKVSPCFANGVPLGAQVKEKSLKQIFLDIGLVSAALGLNLNQLLDITEIDFFNKGALAEQLAGQILRTVEPFYIEPKLFYWQREEPGSNAEIDYIIQHGTEIIPLEIKAGSTGTLKSLHIFMGLKNLTKAVRVNTGLPSKTKIEMKDPLGTQKTVQYDLLSIPFYLLGQVHRLLDLE